MSKLQFVPWRQVSRWQCTSCGCCCKDYSVVLSFPEWLRIAQTFGAQTTVTGMDKFFLKRVDDGSCAFLCRFQGNYLCSLQNMKPGACKIWPFKVLAEPKYGEAKQAVFDFAGKRLFVYVDRNCRGVTNGTPTWEFTTLTIKEFAALALGICGSQHNSTRNLNGYGLRRF
jgi:Fe-S-cluster containining protein